VGQQTRTGTGVEGTRDVALAKLCLKLPFVPLAKRRQAGHAHTISSGCCAPRFQKGQKVRFSQPGASTRLSAVIVLSLRKLRFRTMHESRVVSPACQYRGRLTKSGLMMPTAYVATPMSAKTALGCLASSTGRSRRRRRPRWWSRRRRSLSAVASQQAIDAIIGEHHHMRAAATGASDVRAAADVRRTRLDLLGEELARLGRDDGPVS
jgi:hypothetical protein